MDTLYDSFALLFAFLPTLFPSPRSPASEGPCSMPNVVELVPFQEIENAAERITSRSPLPQAQIYKLIYIMAQ